MRPKNNSSNAARRGRSNKPATVRRRPQKPKRRVAAPRARVGRMIPPDHPASMVPAACRALALTSPCAFIDGTKSGQYNIIHARDPHSALNTNVFPVQGPVQVICNSAGQALVLVSLCPTGAIRHFADDFTSDSFTDLPSGGIFLNSMERLRPISLQVEYVPTMSMMNNQGNLTIAALEPAMAKLDYLDQGAVTLSARIQALKDHIDSRSPQSYDMTAAKNGNSAVIGVQDAWDYYSIGGVVYTLAAPGNNFSPSTIAGNNAIGTIASPIAKVLYYSDLLPCVAIIIEGAASLAPFTLRVCALFEGQPATAMMPTLPAPTGGTAGLMNLASKIRKNAGTASSVLHGAEKAEHYIERGAEGVLKVASIAGVPYADDVRMVAHAGQSLLERGEHFLGF